MEGEVEGKERKKQKKKRKETVSSSSWKRLLGAVDHVKERRVLRV